jgi:hypothetical protein
MRSSLFSSSFYGEEFRQNVDERLGDNANTDVLVGVITIINDITTIRNDKHNLVGSWV